MKVLVTGSSGFIGKWACDLFMEKRHEVIGIDRASSSGPARKGCYLQRDILDLDALIKVFKEHQPDAAVHLAARKMITVYRCILEGKEIPLYPSPSETCVKIA